MKARNEMTAQELFGEFRSVKAEDIQDLRRIAQINPMRGLNTEDQMLVINFADTLGHIHNKNPELAYAALRALGREAGIDLKSPSHHMYILCSVLYELGGKDNYSKHVLGT